MKTVLIKCPLLLHILNTIHCCITEPESPLSILSLKLLVVKILNTRTLDISQPCCGLPSPFVIVSAYWSLIFRKCVLINQLWIVLSKIAIYFYVISVMPQIPLGRTSTHSRKGQRVPTYHFVLLVYVTIIIKSSFKYGYNSSMKINHISKPKIDVQGLDVGVTMPKRQDTIILNFTLIYKVYKRYIDLVNIGKCTRLTLNYYTILKHI